MFSASIDRSDCMPTIQSYQWQKYSGSSWANLAEGDGTKYSGTTTTASLIINSLVAGDAGIYRAVLTYYGGCTQNTPTATLTVRPLISPTVTPPATLCDGATATFSVTPNDPTIYTYQWQVNSGSGWTNVATGMGGTTPQYSFTATYTDNGKQYRVVVGYAVSSPSCKVISPEVLLTVRPTISLDCPDDVSLCNGGTATFTVTPTPADTGQYQHQWDVSTDDEATWTPITTATGPTYSFTASLANNSNKYRVTVKYSTEPYCEASPCIATLTVRVISVTVGSPMTICVEDGPITLSGTATNAQSAQWSVESGGAYGGDIEFV